MEKNSFWSRLSLVVFIVCSFTVSVKAAQFGDFTYTDNGADITITKYTGSGGAVDIPSTINAKPVTGIGNLAFSDCTSLTSITIPNSVIIIGNSAFYHCSGLTSVTIGNSVTSIGDDAFRNCFGLTNIAIPESVISIGDNAFRNCSATITVNELNPAYSSEDGVLFNKDKTTLIRCPEGKVGSYTIPNSVTSIRNSAFYHCYDLISVTIGNSVSSIGDGEFYACYRLTAITVDALNPAYSSEDGVLFNKNKTTLIRCPEGKVGSYTIPNSVTSIRNSAFYECFLTSITIGNSVISIGDYAFRDCYDLTSITIGNGVISIGDHAFLQCNSLTSIAIPNSVISIGKSAFNACDVLANITIGNSVSSIGDGAFSGLRVLTSITIPNSVASIGDAAFYGSGLTSITIPNSVASIGDAAFSYCIGMTSATIGNSVIGNSAFYHCSGLTSATIGNSVTIIGQSAFYNCTSLTSITIPNSVTSIGDAAFYGSGLTNVTIGNSVTSIGYGAFGSCTSLTSVTIGNSVINIGDNSFSGCTELTGVYFQGNPPSLGSGVFSGDSKATAYYSPGSTGWSLTFGGLSAIGLAPNYKYVTNENTITITKYTGSGGAVEIPGMIGSQPVTGIGESAFSSCTGLTNVMIPNSVTSIGSTAFFSCTNLVNAVFLGNAPSMGSWVFNACASNFAVYYKSGALGFTSPTWEGYPSAIAYTVTYDAKGGSVSPANKTVLFGLAYGTLASPIRTDYSFLGWWTGNNGTGTQVAATTIVNNATNQTIYAKWRLDAMIGLAFEFPLPMAFSSSTNVAVKGLPAGLKYNALTRIITGIPTKPGTFIVEISASGVSSQTITIGAVALPEWAQGTFNGWGVNGNDYGTATMTVTALGKVTGKLSASGKNFPFSAASYSQSDEDGALWISTKIIVDKVDVPLLFKVTNPDGVNPTGLSLAEGWPASDVEGEPAVKMYRNVWKDTDMLTEYAGYYTAVLPGGDEYGSGYLTITLDKVGGVKTTGKLADGTVLSLSSSLILDETGRVFTVIYTSPAAYKGGCLFGLAEFVKPDGEGKVYMRLFDAETQFIWENRTPQPASVYTEHFKLTLGLVGGWYDKTANLYDYYRDMVLKTGANEGATAPQLSVGVATYDASCWEFGDIGLSTVRNLSDEMTGLSAPAAGFPVKIDNNWDYSADNCVGLKIGFTRATGIFKGSFKAWFDYNKTHTSKSISYEGALTPEREDNGDGIAGRGFFLWANPLSGHPFNRSYDFLINE
jgi:uncharacterized repeat protein (TIGR02543 family)